MHRSGYSLRESKMVNAFYDKVYALQQKMRGATDAFDAANGLLDQYERAIDLDAKPHLELTRKLEVLRQQSREITKLLSNGSPQDERVGNRSKPSIQTRLRNARGSLFSLAGPTGTHRDSLKTANQLYAELYPDLKKFIEIDVKQFGQSVRKAGLSWTSGQPIPKPNKQSR